MARRILKDKIVQFKDIGEEIRLIEGSNTDYITPSGKVYKDYLPYGYFKKKLNVNKCNGYIYCGITMDNGKNKNKRVHRLVANAFIPNTENLPIVGHMDNNKTNNDICNLYWTTISENTQKAVDDGLMINKKGYEDSQSMPVVVYDLKWHEIGRFGSVSECHRELNISKNTILNQCKEKMTGSPRKGYRFKFQ